jgi:hypothetical protein
MVREELLRMLSKCIDSLQKKIIKGLFIEQFGINNAEYKVTTVANKKEWQTFFTATRFY